MKITPINSVRNYPMTGNNIVKPVIDSAAKKRQYIDLAKTAGILSFPLFVFLYLERVIFKKNVTND